MNVVATLNDSMTMDMVWNYHDLNINTLNQDIEITVKGIPSKKIEITHFRVDQKFSNSYETWKEIGSPQNLTEAQYTEPEKSGKFSMIGKQKTVRIKNGQYYVNLELPRQAVSLLIFNCSN